MVEMKRIEIARVVSASICVYSYIYPGNSIVFLSKALSMQLFSTARLQW